MLIGLGIGLPFASAISLAAQIAALFAAGEQGAWYDTSDFSTLFQDSAGTTPVTTVGQPVGLILDKSGNGKHATQATAASRPVLSARVNLLTKTEALTDAGVWAPTSGATVVASAVAAPDGTFTAFDVGSLNSPAARLDTDTGTPAANAGPYTYSVYLRGSGTIQINVSSTTGVGPATEVSCALTSTWTRFSVSNTFDGTSTGNVRIHAVISRDGGQSGIVNVWRPHLESGPTATRYQRVNTATDYDTVGFKLKETFDGVDDSQATTTGGGASTSAMIVLGFRSTLAGAAQTLWSDRTGNTGLKLEKTVANVIAFSGGNGASVNTATGDAVALNTDYVVTALYDGVNLSVQLNSATAVTAACTLSAGQAAITLGADTGAAAAFFKGDVYEVIYVKDDVQTTSQITSAKQFVASKSGVTL